LADEAKSENENLREELERARDQATSATSAAVSSIHAVYCRFPDSASLAASSALSRAGFREQVLMLVRDRYFEWQGFSSVTCFSLEHAIELHCACC